MTANNAKNRFYFCKLWLYKKNETINIILKILENYNFMESTFQKANIKIFKKFNIFCKKGLKLNSLNYIFFLVNH